MYHPELYPELSKNNAKVEPLDDRLLNRLKEKSTRKQIIKKEITVLDNSFNNNNLAKSIQNFSLKARNLRVNDFANRFEISPILKEINEVGAKYLIPDYDSSRQSIINKLNSGIEALKSESELAYLDYIAAESTDDETFNMQKIKDTSNEFDLYLKEIKRGNNALPIKNVLEKLKSQGMISENIDTSDVKIEEDYNPNYLKHFDKDQYEQAKLLHKRKEINDLLTREWTEEDIEKLGAKNNDQASEILNNELAEIESKLATSYRKNLEKAHKREEIRLKNLKYIVNQKKKKLTV